MELEVHQQIYYSNKKWVPIGDIATSLLALESLIKQSPAVLEALFPGTKIQRVDVFVNELKSDSIWEDLVVKFIFGNQQQFDEVIKHARERIGMDHITKNPKVLSSIFIAMVLIGGTYLLTKDSSKQDNKTTIEANNNTIINIGSEMIDMDPLMFKTLIEGAIKDKEKLAKDAVKIVNPAKLDPTASIMFEGSEELTITNSSVKAMPKQISNSNPLERIEDYESLRLEIRAIDLDSSKRGWAVVAPDIHTKRIPLQIDPTVRLDELQGKRIIDANVSVVFVYDSNKNEFIPKLVFLREINKPES